VVQKKITKFNAPSVCNHLQQNHTIFTKMLRKDHCQPVNAKFVLVG